MTTGEIGTVYLLHFSAPYKHAKHYIGWTSDLDGRLKEHAHGSGARLLAVIKDAGLTFKLACTWPGTRSDERRLHNAKCSPVICPICNPGTRLYQELSHDQPRTICTETHAARDPGPADA